MGGQILLPRKAGGIPRVSTRFSLSVENEQAYAGRDGQTRLARPKYQAQTGAGNITFVFPSADHEKDRQPYPVDPYTAICDDHILPGCVTRAIILK